MTLTVCVEPTRLLVEYTRRKHLPAPPTTRPERWFFPIYHRFPSINGESPIMDEHVDESCGDYSLEEEDERFRRDLETALELSLQEQSMRDFSDSLEWTLKEIQVEVSRPVALSKDDPVSTEIRADLKRQEVDVLKQNLAQTSLRNGATPEKKVLQRLSQGRTWAQRVSAGSCRENAGVSSENCGGDTSASPHSDDFDVDNIPRCPVGEGSQRAEW
ncbi:uncharacterized protein LOC126184227 [Schistocerca cancellata]|uniref:uncharacterized protein LOC126184227 n=1 Tax=Schistocerca cancellata TaxID=274614 RepID=UPI002118CA7D|nr:uncharacterized protein LOC126184227 [Schistocerca cancellata]